MGSIYDNPDDLKKVEEAFRRGKTRGLLLKQGDFNSMKSQDTSSIYSAMRPLTRDDFECEEDWLTYSLNQWFGHFFIDPHLD